MPAQISITDIALPAAIIFLSLLLFHFYRRRIRRDLELKYDRQTKALREAVEKYEKAHLRTIEDHRNLVEANQSKTDLLNILAHDLKSPMISIKMLAKMIIEESEKKSQVADYAADIFSTVQRVHNLVDEILDSSIIESGIFVIDKIPVDLGKLCELIVLDNSIAASQKRQKIIFKSDDLCVAKGDELRLKMIVDNLITNAIKYSQLDRGIWVTVGKMSKFIQVEVRDEGPGISGDDMKKMFKKFQRLSAQPTGGEPSTGLGLSIVKNLVDLHGGTIEVESEIGKGTKMKLMIPAWEAPR